jgi:hypothetical protein
MNLKWIVPPAYPYGIKSYPQPMARSSWPATNPFDLIILLTFP